MYVPTNPIELPRSPGWIPRMHLNLTSGIHELQGHHLEIVTLPFIIASHHSKILENLYVDIHLQMQVLTA